MSERERRFSEAEAERKRSNAATFDNASASEEEGDEFGRFEDLTRQLVNTPKPKADGDES